MSDARRSSLSCFRMTHWTGRRGLIRFIGFTGFIVVLSCGTIARAAWDFSISGFGGYSVPFKTDIQHTGPGTNFTGKDGKLENSASYGGKITAWTTAPRRRFGLDFGAEIDVTHFNPNVKSQTLTTTGTLLGIPFGSPVLASNAKYGPIDVSATTIALNF